MADFILHYDGHTSARREAVTLKIHVPNQKLATGCFTYARLLNAFDKHCRRKYAHWTLPFESLALSANGRFLPLDSTVSAQHTDLQVVENSTRTPPSEARSACAAFGTLDLVDGKAGSLAGERASREWFLRPGILSDNGIDWASRGTADVLSCDHVHSCDASWLHEVVLSYKLGFACVRERKFDDAVAALAKAARGFLYRDDVSRRLGESWARKIFHEWGQAVALRDHAAGDRWNEVAIHKFGAACGVWPSWERRPVDVCLCDLAGRAVWSDLPIYDRLTGVDDDLTRLEEPGRIDLPHDDYKHASDLARRISVDPLLRVECCYLCILEPHAHLETRCAPTNVYLHAQRTLSASGTTFLRVADTLIDDFDDNILVYDPSFEHELWYDGDAPRVAFVCEFAHPDLPTTQLNP